MLAWPACPGLACVEVVIKVALPSCAREPVPVPLHAALAYPHRDIGLPITPLPEELKNL